jgi:RNA polymerase sigma factor (sigma-70 family)
MRWTQEGGAWLAAGGLTLTRRPPHNLDMASGVDPAVASRAYDRARASRWGLDPAVFSRALATSLESDTIDGLAAAPPRAVETLHLEDLALAVACAEGIDAAWDHFMREFRPALYRAADAIDASGGARDLADALYADLYGLAARGGERRSLLRHFHGRSRLATWLRAVLSQRYVDHVRASRRLTAMPDDDVMPAPESAPAPDRSRFATLIEMVLTTAMAALAPRDRLRLSLYYLRGLTLAEIGRMLREHEGTVSRHLTRTRRELRASMETRLRTAHGLDPVAIDECFRTALDDTGGLDLARVLSAAGKKSVVDRSS